MAKVQNVKEKLHLPLYDAVFVPGQKNGTAAKRFGDVVTERVMRFFVDVQNKTKLETNMQAAGVLPSLNSFEARALRVVASTFCPPRAALEAMRKTILDKADMYCDATPNNEEKRDQAAQDQLVNDIQKRFQEISGAASVNGHIRDAILDAADLYCDTRGTSPTPDQEDRLVKSILDAFEAGCEAASTALPELIYNSVTSLLVGEKTMMEAPTWMFPSGAGVSPGNGTTANHGEPDPMATFRFAEPVIIDSQQNFRVEMQFPQGVPGTLLNLLGPLHIWVVLDGYLTRDVQ
jgi:hypothetical protein